MLLIILYNAICYMEYFNIFFKWRSSVIMVKQPADCHLKIVLYKEIYPYILIYVISSVLAE